MAGSCSIKITVKKKRLIVCDICCWMDLFNCCCFVWKVCRKWIMFVNIRHEGPVIFSSFLEVICERLYFCVYMRNLKIEIRIEWSSGSEGPHIYPYSVQSLALNGKNFYILCSNGPFCKQEKFKNTIKIIRKTSSVRTTIF